jgi:hypothetical protein
LRVRHSLRIESLNCLHWLFLFHWFLQVGWLLPRLSFIIIPFELRVYLMVLDFIHDCTWGIKWFLYHPLVYFLFLSTIIMQLFV